MRTFSMALRHLSLLLLLTFTLAACDSNESDPELDGNWSGTTVIDGVPVILNMLLAESDGAVSGNGTIVIGESFAITITGTHDFPNVSLTIASSEFTNLSFSGTVSADEDQITGNLSGSGLQNTAITITR